MAILYKRMRSRRSLETVTEAGLPETDEAAGHQRTEDGQVVPKAESVAQSMLQRPAPSDVCALRTRLAVC